MQPLVGQKVRKEQGEPTPPLGPAQPHLQRVLKKKTGNSGGWPGRGGGSERILNVSFGLSRVTNEMWKHGGEFSGSPHAPGPAHFCQPLPASAGPAGAAPLAELAEPQRQREGSCPDESFRSLLHREQQLPWKPLGCRSQGFRLEQPLSPHSRGKLRFACREAAGVHTGGGGGGGETARFKVQIRLEKAQPHCAPSLQFFSCPDSKISLWHKGNQLTLHAASAARACAKGPPRTGEILTAQGEETVPRDSVSGLVRALSACICQGTRRLRRRVALREG